MGAAVPLMATRLMAAPLITAIRPIGEGVPRSITTIIMVIIGGDRAEPPSVQAFLAA